MAASSEYNYFPWKVLEEQHPNGFSIFRCIPPYWMPKHDERKKYCVEALSAQTGVHKDPDFWTASDAAMRAQKIPAENLGLREIAIHATRRSNDYNSPTPWATRSFVKAMEQELELADDPNIHPYARIPNSNDQGIYGKYGMRRTVLPSGNYTVKTGFGMRPGKRPEVTPKLFEGGLGKWVTWQTLLTWQRIPRRQDIEALRLENATSGKLLLFISHRWEDLAEPDPTGRQLQALKTGLEMALISCLLENGSGTKTTSGLPEVMHQYLSRFYPTMLESPELHEWAKQAKEIAIGCTTEEAYLEQSQRIKTTPLLADILRNIQNDVLLWYDYASMYQSPRTAEEQADFAAELLLLNKIQECATTVVLPDNDAYMSRAWCFLEVSGGIRNSITELTPSWADEVRIYADRSAWASISDQLIGALKIHGPEALPHTELETTHPEDMTIIAKLISELPLMGLTESDGMDLVGGFIPMPYIEDEGWVYRKRELAAYEREEQILNIPPVTDFGNLLQIPPLNDYLPKVNKETQLAGACGMWIYTSQRMLSLAWNQRAQECHELVNNHYKTGELGGVCCTWADSRGLAEDGMGWSGYIPSTVKTLIIVTQADLPEICLLYESVLRHHIIAGCEVITLNPEVGKVTITRQAKVLPIHCYNYHLLHTPRLRRSTAYPEYLFLPDGIRKEHLDLLVALRMDQSEQRLPPLQLSEAELTNLSRAMVLTEAESRTEFATWQPWKEMGIHPCSWDDLEDGLQRLNIVRGILQKIARVTTNPVKRRALLYQILHAHAGEVDENLAGGMDEMLGGRG